jgi:small subunit ribosomal protein S2
MKDELEKENSELSKSELSKIRREVEHGEKYLAGLEKLDRKPDAVILFGSHDEKIAVKEAKKMGVTIIALTDTNADPTLIDYPIPANDDATKSVKLIAELFAAAINESKPAPVEKKENGK